LNVEVEQIKKAFKRLDEKYEPGFVEVIINKRINQRFFSQEKNEIYNPRSGTLVCDRVVHDDYFEFYLVPQNVTQGTATPTNFKIIANTAK
jgi:aubergine-like protein